MKRDKETILVRFFAKNLLIQKTLNSLSSNHRLLKSEKNYTI
jgi:hypothetical protein